MIRTTAKKLQSLPIRLKLFYTCSLLLVIAVLLAGISFYIQASGRMEKNIEAALSNATATILKMVSATAESSIKNYLRAVAEKNRQIVSNYHERVQKGGITEADARKALREILFGQTIGETGYIYCLDSGGRAVMHPNPGVEGVNYSEFEFIREQVARKQGYLEYMWKNPGEVTARPKAMYMIYFEPWDWIISVSSYRSEFISLINISDFRENILSQTFGQTGYSYVLASNGDVIIHPHLSGNLWDVKDADGRYLVREQCMTKSGKIAYAWRNPGEDKFREKLVIYNYIPEYDWIVASTGYIEEFYAPLKSIRNLAAITLLVIIGMVLPATFFMAAEITRPLKQLEQKLSQAMSGNFSGRMQIRVRDEIGNLALFFNRFMDELESSDRKVRQEARERKKSEELFTKAFHASPSGIFILNLNTMRFVRANESFLQFLGSRQERIINQPVDHLSVFSPSPGLDRIIELIKKEGRIRNLDVEFTTRDKDVRLGTINAETVHIWGQRCLLCAVADQTETRQLERTLIEIIERERQQLGQYLHDDLSSHLMGIDFMQKSLFKKLDKEASAYLEEVKEIRFLIQEAMGKASRISRGLCPTQIADRELGLALTELCRDMEEIYGISCRLEGPGQAVHLDERRAVHIYYIAREAACNAVKHGGADEICLRMESSGRDGLLVITDNGCGFKKARSTWGMGLKIMAYRAGRIGGSLEIDKERAFGARLALNFSLSKEPEDG